MTTIISTTYSSTQFQTKVNKATTNLEKQATKLAERVASKDISDSERKKLSGALDSINGAIKGLGGNQVSTASPASGASAVKVQISDSARQAMASTMGTVAKATTNLEKEATKLAERAASKDISDSERKKISGALESINGAIKGLGGNQVSAATPASGNSTTQAKTQSPAPSAAADNTSSKNEASRAALNNLEKAYGSGTEYTRSRLNFLA